MKNILEVDSVIKSFGEYQILTDVYIKCETGDIIGILGRNACGKSSLLKIIFGTLNSDNKNIRINKKVYPQAYKNGDLIAYLPQHDFLPKKIKLEKIIKIYIKDPESRNKILNDKRISNHLKKTVNELSGGEKRYFEILLLVNLNVKFVMLDEPFSGIEPLYIKRIKEIICEGSKTKGFIITDHDYRNIIEVSTEILLITNGVCKHIKNLNELEDWNYVPQGTYD